MVDESANANDISIEQPWEDSAESPQRQELPHGDDENSFFLKYVKLGHRGTIERKNMEAAAGNRG